MFLSVADPGAVNYTYIYTTPDMNYLAATACTPGNTNYSAFAGHQRFSGNILTILSVDNYAQWDICCWAAQHSLYPGT